MSDDKTPIQIHTLLDRLHDPALPLPETLVEQYGGPLGFPATGDKPFVYANFVETLDGVISFLIPGESGGGLVSGKNRPDRFTMGLLRAAADVIIVGAGMLRALPKSVWTPEKIFPDAANEYAEFRRMMKKPSLPPTVMVTGSGELDLSLPAFHVPELPVVIITTETGEQTLRQKNTQMPQNVKVKVVTANKSATAEEILRGTVEVTNARLILLEAGPTVTGEFFAGNLVDDLFLTIAPQIAGRDDENRRLALVEHRAFQPNTAPWSQLVSVKSDKNFLYLRYRFRE